MITSASDLSAFYLPENADYTILSSAADSAIYAMSATAQSSVGLNAHSFLTDVEAKPVRANGRLLQGVGYCADAPYAACALCQFDLAMQTSRFTETVQGLINHSVYAGYLDDPDVPIRLYRDVESGEFFDHLEAQNAYFDVGHMAKAVHNLVNLRPYLSQDATNRVESAARRFSEFVLSVPRTTSGWLFRRIDRSMRPYLYARLPPQISTESHGGKLLFDSVADCSGAGLLVVACMMRLTEVGIANQKRYIREICDAFVQAGGYFGSLNTDTEDVEESVSLAIAFQVLLDAASYCGEIRYKDFAYEECLPRLEKFKINSDLNGQKTKGLIRLSASYSSACLWECSEVALAYFRAASDRGRTSDVLSGLTILRAIARNHHGEFGFLPSEIDWDGRMIANAHLERKAVGPRALTHPYMNNLHVVTSTLYYLEKLAWRVTKDGNELILDAQGNRL